MHYHANFRNYVVPPNLPVYIEFVKKGKHPANHIHDHNFTEIVIILSGEGLYNLEGGTVNISTGDLLIVPPGLQHGYDQVENLELVNLTYQSEELVFQLLDAYELPLFELFFPPGGKRFDPKLFLYPAATLDQEQLREATLQLRQLQSLLRHSGNGAYFQAQGLFIFLIAQLARHENKTIPHSGTFDGFENVLAIMQKKMAQKCSISELAAATHTSQRTFLRLFKKATGVSPTEYLKQLRLRHGAKLLYSTNLPISRIALECGFYDSSHFTVKFKSFYGHSPSQYRTAMRRQSNTV